MDRDYEPDLRVPSAGTPGLRTKGSGGRPRAADSALIVDRIVAAASALFLRDGYAATSIEAIAAAVGVSKRTFYARFDSKAAVFLAVVHLLVREWLQGFDEVVEVAGGLEATLVAVGRRMLDVALLPDALALYALVASEARRLPELSQALRQGGTDAGISRVAALLREHMPQLDAASAWFAAEQFQSMVVSVPQRRALTLGELPDPADRDAWCRATARLLLEGVRRGLAVAGC